MVTIQSGFRYLYVYLFPITCLGLSVISITHAKTEADITSWIDDNDLSVNQQIDTDALSFSDSHIASQSLEDNYIITPKRQVVSANSVDDLHKKPHENRSKGKLRKAVGHNRLVKGKGLHHMLHVNPKMNVQFKNNRAKSYKKVVDDMVDQSDEKEIKSSNEQRSEPIKEINRVEGTNKSEQIKGNVELNQSPPHSSDQGSNNNTEANADNTKTTKINTETNDDIEPDGSELLDSQQKESVMMQKTRNQTVDPQIRRNKFKYHKSNGIDNKNKETKNSDEGFINDLRKTHLNRLIERKLKTQLKNKGYIKYEPLQTLKFTNTSFINGFQKKIQSLKDNAMFNDKLQASDKIFTKTNENTDWIFDQPKDKTVNDNVKFGHDYECKKLNHLRDSKHINAHTNSKETNNKGYYSMSNNHSSALSYLNPKLLSIYKKRNEIKGKDKITKEDSSGLNMNTHEAEQLHYYKRRTNKKVHSKIYPKENNIDNFENETEKKRNERDVKGNRSKVNINKRSKSTFVRHGLDNKDNEMSDENEDKDDDDPESVDDIDFEPNYHRQLQTNGDEDYSYKSHSQDSGESELSGEDVDKNDESKRIFGSRVQESSYNNEISPTETCVGYKAGAMATKSCPQTISSQTTTKSICSTQKRGNYMKIKNTTCRPVNSTKKTPSPSKAKNGPNQSVPMEALDTYDKFLCGQLIDDFIEAVLAKVRRSPKIQKELGFQNDTEESCDRCIETKLNNMPDLETMKMSLGKCGKTSTKSNCFKCYNVPKPMDRFLSLLVSYEKDHETNIYSKIKDESSFIFSGDYSDEQIGSDDGILNRKYSQDMIGKDEVDKERLRDDLNEDKNDDPNISSASLNNKSNTKQSGYSTETKEENEVNRSGSKLNLNYHNKETNVKRRDHEKPQIRTVTSFKDGDLEEEFDPLVPSRNKADITYKDPEPSVPDDSLMDSYSGNQMRNSYKHNNKQMESFGQPEKFKHETNRHVRPHNGEAELGHFDYKPLNMYNDQNTLNGGIHSSYGQSKSIGENKYANNLNFEGNHPYKYEYSVEVNHDNRIKHPQSLYNYPTGYDKNYRMYPELNKKTEGSMSNMDLGVLDSDYDEYPLVSNQINRHPNKNVGGLRAKEQYDMSYQDGQMRMVKRDIEPNDEEETIVFEIPDIEYDLY